MRPLILAILLAACSACSEKTEQFDRERWAKADLDGRERAEMMPSLLRDHPLVGMTRAQVVSLLGQPTPTDKWSDADMIYVLGNDGSYTPIDNEWLLIDLDQSQKVTSLKRVRD
jgi:outer membrane protein assembly factor BamE (lipoprotein component of BamABCDE complex)